MTLMVAWRALPRARFRILRGDGASVRSPDAPDLVMCRKSVKVAMMYLCLAVSHTLVVAPIIPFSARQVHEVEQPHKPLQR